MKSDGDNVYELPDPRAAEMAKTAADIEEENTRKMSQRMKWLALAVALVSLTFFVMFAIVFVMLAQLPNEKNSPGLTDAALKRLWKLSGWYSASDNFCYRFFKKKVNYEDATSRCENLGGSLLAKGLRNVTVFRELLANVLQSDIKGCKTWIGYKHIKNDWAWIDGETHTSVVEWNDGQPDYTGSNSCAAHIAHYDNSYKARINDAPCTYLCPYTCEVPIY